MLCCRARLAAQYRAVIERRLIVARDNDLRNPLMESRMDMKPEVSFEDFVKLDLRVGTVLKAELNPKARQPAFKLEIDFGPLGVLHSSAQITQNHSAELLPGTQVVAVVNFPIKRVAGVSSQCLILGAVSESLGVVCLNVSQPVENGTQVA